MFNNLNSCEFCTGQISFWDNSGSGFVLCDSCGLIYRSPMPSEDELSEMYAKYYSQENVTNSNTRMVSCDTSVKQQIKYISSISKPGWRILDFGAGTGELVNGLSNNGALVDGIEYSYDAILEAKNRYGIKLMGTIDELAQEDKEKYDLIVAVEVVEHLTNPAETLSLLFRCLKPGGVIYLTTPNVSGLKARIRKSNWSEALKPFHLVLFNFKSLKYILESRGFCSVKYVRFSPLTVTSPIKIIFHRFLQLLGLYGGLRILAHKPNMKQ